MKETPVEVVDMSSAFLRSVAFAFARAGRYVPCLCKCYEQAIAAKMILKGRGIATTMYYGVAKDQAGRLFAHAWLRCGNYIVTGRNGMERFTVVGMFS